MNINVKFKSQEDYQSVVQLSKYVGMTPKQFARTAVLKQTQELVLEINRRIADARAVADAKREENNNVGELSTVQSEATHGEEVNSTSPDSPA